MKRRRSSVSPILDLYGRNHSTDGLVGALKTVLTSSGIIVEDPRTNSIIVTDIPSQFPLIENTLARLDVSVPQILIEVEMLDISKNTAEQMGVKFGNRPLNFEGAERQHLYPWDQNEILDKGFEFTEEYTAGTISAAGLKAALEFLKTQTDTRSLARPRILTLNNQTAQIKISTQEAIGTTTESQSDTGSTSVEAERVETGVSLTVTPQANLVSGEITMAIYPKVTEAKAGATFEDRTFKDPEERGSQSILKVYSGDTIILGGLLKSDDTKTVTKVPFFGDIPILGNAFKHKDSVGRERELVIFITPYIIEDKAVPTSSTSVRQSKKDVYIPLEREQDNSPKRKSEIDRALSTFEGEGL